MQRNHFDQRSAKTRCKHRKNGYDVQDAGIRLDCVLNIT